MASSLWRVLALAWLGGVASPALLEDPASSETAIESRSFRTPAAGLPVEAADVGDIEATPPTRPLASTASTRQ